jgi:Domain of unknown function (DUF1902)
MSIETVSIGSRSIMVDIRWDAEASVWIATSKDIHGLVVEADTWPILIEEIQLVAPELLEVMSSMKSRSPNAR